MRRVLALEMIRVAACTHSLVMAYQTKQVRFVDLGLGAAPPASGERMDRGVRSWIAGASAVSRGGCAGRLP